MSSRTQKSVVHFEQEGCIFHLYGEQKPLGGMSPNFFGGRGPRRNHAIQIWWRLVQGFWVGRGSKFAFSHILWRSSLQHSPCHVRCDRVTKFVVQFVACKFYNYFFSLQVWLLVVCRFCLIWNNIMQSVSYCFVSSDSRSATFWHFIITRILFFYITSTHFANWAWCALQPSVQFFMKCIKMWI